MTTTVEDLITRRVSRGHREADSRAVLADLLLRHAGDNLTAALVYEGFASEAQAQGFFDGLPRPADWDEWGSSAKDLWEERHISSIARRLERQVARA